MYFYLFYYLGRNATNNGIRFYILRHHSTCCHYCSIANSHACKNGGTLTLGWVKVMIDGCQHDIMAYECTLVNGDAALILELTTHIDEHPLTNNGIFAAIGMERREQAYRLGHFTSPKLFQQIV